MQRMYPGDQAQHSKIWVYISSLKAHLIVAYWLHFLCLTTVAGKPVFIAILTFGICVNVSSNQESHKTKGLPYMCFIIQYCFFSPTLW